MQMENKPEGLEDLFQKMKEYAEVQVNLLRLKGARKLASSLSSIVSSVILVVISGAILFCFTIGISLLVGDWLGKTYYGFFIVGGIYVIAGIIIYRMRNKLIKRKVTDKLIRELLD